MAAIWADDLLDAELARHRHWTDRIFGGRAGEHFDQDAVEQCRARSEATLLVVANEHELFDSAFLGRGQDEAADANRLAVEGFDRVGKLLASKGFAGGRFESQVVERFIKLAIASG